MQPDEFKTIVLNSETDEEIIDAMYEWGLPREGDPEFKPYE